MTKTLFLPGAGASKSFWQSVAHYVQADHSVFFSWPGLGNEPAVPEINGIEDLVAMVLKEMEEPVNLVAQSMGGIVAIKAALARPDKVNKLVLVATSAGIPMEEFGGANWQIDYYQSFPHAAKWIGQINQDLSCQISLIEQPTLLIWGDQDVISPLAVGQRLSHLLPHAHLAVIAGGAHNLAQIHVKEVSDLIKDHLKDIE